MTIKRRTPEEDRAAAIAAFAEGAAPEPAPAAATPKPVTLDGPARPAPTSAIDEEASRVSLTMLVRFPDSDLPVRLQRLAAADDRSKHYMVLRALEAGLAVLEARS
ncbi:hypothetical protein GCM10009846_22440 [Agrococcus versicolor]|uniref:CopG family transcriptional regulator n=1 Tax=Agrococcus versicolor TaxID=501482 RepID=A0ABN3AUA1_9MICO